MSLHLRFTQFGNLELEEVYEFYDRPLLFVCHNIVGNKFLAVIVDETDIYETWLYAPISKTRFNQIRSGIIDLHDAFTQVEDGTVYRVDMPRDQLSDVEISFVPSMSLTDDQLPLRGERLHLATQTLPSVTSVEELRIRAIQSLREHVTLRMTLPDRTMTEAPSELLGGVLQRFQYLINSVSISLRGIANAKSHGSIPQMNVLNFSHGSFSVELASDSSVDLFRESEAGLALEHVIELIEIGDDADRFKQEIDALRPHVAVEYALFLKELGVQVSNTAIDWASPKEGRVRSANITSKQAGEAIKMIEKIELQTPETIVVYGTLIGANLRSKTFEIQATEDKKMKKYSGRIKDDSVQSVKGAELGRDYQVTMTRTLEINYTLGKAEPKYTLINLVAGA